MAAATAAAAAAATEASGNGCGDVDGVLPLLLRARRTPLPAAAAAAQPVREDLDLDLGSDPDPDPHPHRVDVRPSRCRSTSMHPDPSEPEPGPSASTCSSMRSASMDASWPISSVHSSASSSSSIRSTPSVHTPAGPRPVSVHTPAASPWPISSVQRPASSSWPSSSLPSSSGAQLLRSRGKAPDVAEEGRGKAAVAQEAPVEHSSAGRRSGVPPTLLQPVSAGVWAACRHACAPAHSGTWEETGGGAACTELAGAAATALSNASTRRRMGGCPSPGGPGGGEGRLPEFAHRPRSKGSVMWPRSRSMSWIPVSR